MNTSGGFGAGAASGVVHVHRRVLELRQLRERAANLAVLQAGRKAAEARANADRMRAHVQAERDRLARDIARCDRQADSQINTGRWFVNTRDHFDQRRIEIQRLQLQLAELHRQWQACREELARRRQVLSVMQARREQIQNLTRRAVLRERSRVEARREAGIAELLSARARQRGGPPLARAAR